MLWQTVAVLWVYWVSRGQCVAVLWWYRRRVYHVWTSIVVVLSATRRPVRRAVVIYTSRPLRRSTWSRVVLSPSVVVLGGASVGCGVLPREVLRSPLLRGVVHYRRVV